jgi:hypothetical protein
MPIRITVNMFSGLTNPGLIIDGPEEREILARLRPGRQLKRGEMLPAPESVLGYRGITIEQLGRVSRGLPKVFRVANGDLIGEGLAHRAADESADESICGSTGPLRVLQLGDRFIEIVQRGIKEYLELRRKYPRTYPHWPIRNRCACAPLYEPAWWNVYPRQGANNCYNYGTNYRTDTYAQPGQAAGVSHSLTCPTVTAAAVADGLINRPTANNRCPAEGHLVALVLAPYDYHWYRKGRNGYWTHKMDGAPATNLDNSGNLIPDPRTANRGAYTKFCTFMVVMHGHTKIR